MGGGDKRFLRVQLDRTKYHAGETVQGRILMRLDSPTEISNLKMEVFGVEDTWFRSTRSASGMTRQNAVHAYNFKTNNEFSSESAIFPATNLTLHKFARGQKIKGDFEFPFSFQLHPNLPGSTNLILPADGQMEGGFCRTIYKIQVEAENENTFGKNLKAQQEVYVLPFAPPNSARSANETFEVQSFWCCNHGSINTELSVEKGVCAPGETIDVRVQMTNVSSKKIKLELLLVKNVKVSGAEMNRGFFGADDRTEEFPVDICEKKYKKVGIVSKKSLRSGVHDETYQIEIPKDIDPDVIGTYVVTSHQLVLRAKVSMGDSMLVLIPINIADSPTNKYSPGVVPSCPCPVDFKPTVFDTNGVVGYHFNLIQMAPQMVSMMHTQQRLLSCATSFQMKQYQQRSFTQNNMFVNQHKPPSQEHVFAQQVQGEHVQQDQIIAQPVAPMQEQQQQQQQQQQVQHQNQEQLQQNQVVNQNQNYYNQASVPHEPVQETVNKAHRKHLESQGTWYYKDANANVSEQYEQ